MTKINKQLSINLPSVAILNPLSILGGSEISLLELLKRSTQNFQFHLILPEDGPLKEKAGKNGVNVCTIKWPEKLLKLGERNKKISVLNFLLAVLTIPRLSKEISHLLEDIHCKVLITNGIKCHIIGAVIRKKQYRSLIWYLREGLEGRRLTSLALKLFSTRCDAAITISNFVASESRGVLPGRLTPHILYNIIDLKKFKPGLPIPSDIIKPDGEIWFGTIGAITPLKGQDLFLKAAVKVFEAISNSRFFIVGSNFYKTEASLQYEKNLHKQVQSSLLTNRVQFLGYREDIAQILSAFDVLVQPNRGPEGLGRSVLEAMACRVPVVAVDRWGPAELISHNSTGMLFQHMDVESLANRMIQLGRDASLRKRLGVGAFNWIQNELEPNEIARKFIKILSNKLQ